jgi:hypothetical protein
MPINFTGKTLQQTPPKRVCNKLQIGMTQYPKRPQFLSTLWKPEVMHSSLRLNVILVWQVSYLSLLKSKALALLV